MTDRTGDILDDKYRLSRLIGKGGMGSVYEAEHTRISRRLAVKVLHDELGRRPQAVERFLREARAASAIGHRNIIDVQDIGATTDGTHFMVLELLEGESLSSFIKQRGSVPPEQAVAITLQVLSGLQAAHAKGIIHRDLKPHNVFLARDAGGRFEVKILDFGVSKLTSGDTSDMALTRTGAVVGTPLYMSPEQARGEKDIDERTDIWAVGVMLYQMLSGKLPFQGESYNELISRILLEPVPPLTAEAPHLPPGLVAVVDIALAKERTARYRDAGRFSLELSALELGPSSQVGDVQVNALEPTISPFESVLSAAPPPSGLLRQDRPSGADSIADRPTLSSGGRISSVPVAGSAPLWKRTLWYAVTLPLAWLPMVVPLTDATSSLLSIFGLPEETAPYLGYGTSVALGLLLTWASILVARFWTRGEIARWLQRSEFFIVPLAGFVLVYRCHEVLVNRINTALISFKSYTPIGTAQASEIVGLIGEAWEQHLTTSAIVMLVVFLLSFLVLLGYVFVPPQGRRRPDYQLRWLTLPAGLTLIVVGEVFLFPDELGRIGFWRFPSYLLWVLMAVPVLRENRPESRPTSYGWRALAAGTTALVAHTALSSAAGYKMAFELLRDNPQEVMPVQWERTADIVVTGLTATWAILLALIGLLVAVCLPTLGRGSIRGKWGRTRSSLAAAAVILLTGLPLLTLNAGNEATREAFSLPWGRPGIVEMMPGALAPDLDPTFYIDRRPSTLSRARLELFRELSGKPISDYSVAGLVASLNGHDACPEVLAAAVSDPAVGPAPSPARCVTAIEARLYCRLRGKRLPSPEEWDASVASLPASTVDPGDSSERPWRGPFGEWTMRLVHDTPTFEVRGVPGERAGAGVPQKPEQHSPQVGFRCAFQHER